MTKYADSVTFYDQKTRIELRRSAVRSSSRLTLANRQRGARAARCEILQVCERSGEIDVFCFVVVVGWVVRLLMLTIGAREIVAVQIRVFSFSWSKTRFGRRDFLQRFVARQEFSCCVVRKVAKRPFHMLNTNLLKNNERWGRRKNFGHIGAKILASTEHILWTLPCQTNLKLANIFDIFTMS